MRLHLLGLAAAVVSCAACSFRVSATPADGSVDGTDPPADGALDAPVDASIDSPDPVPVFCDTSNPELLGCWEMDGVVDNVSPANLSTSANNVMFVAGRQGMAVRMSASSQINVAETSALDPPAITIEAWIRVSALPGAGTRMGIADNNGQYGFFLQPSGLQCVGLTASPTIATNTWTHVACTYDGTTRLYVDGLEVGASAGGGAPLGTGGATGLSIGADNPPGAGSALAGDLDQLRMFRSARTPLQICEAAGRPSCS